MICQVTTEIYYIAPWIIIQESDTVKIIPISKSSWCCYLYTKNSSTVISKYVDRCSNPTRGKISTIKQTNSVISRPAKKRKKKKVEVRTQLLELFRTYLSGVKIFICIGLIFIIADLPSSTQSVANKIKSDTCNSGSHWTKNVRIQNYCYKSSLLLFKKRHK